MLKCRRKSETKSLKRGFWCFLESWSVKLTKRIDIIIFKQARPVPNHFQVSMLLFFLGSLSFGMWKFSFLASQNWNCCESCETCRDQTYPKSFESQKTNQYNGKWGHILTNQYQKNNWAVIKGPWMVGLCRGLNYPVLLGLLQANIRIPIGYTPWN